MSLKDLARKYLNRKPDVETLDVPTVTINYNGNIEELMAERERRMLRAENDYTKIEQDLAKALHFGHGPWPKVETGRLSSFRPRLEHEPRWGLSPVATMIYGLMKRRFLFVNAQNKLIYVDQATVQDRVMETGKVVNVGVPFIGALEPGWKVEACHKRWYANEGAQKMQLLTGAEAEKRLPIKVAFLYPNGSTQAQEYKNDPDVCGGETTVTIHTPYGFFAQGVSRCAMDDQFDKKVGRDIALTRAVNKLNEVMNS